MNDLLTLVELCKWLKVDSGWVYRQTREKKIPFMKIGKYLRFSKEEIDEWLTVNKSE